ncbi:MAG: rRNA maturation RNase YbeY [Bacteroidota bacterium]
MPQKQPASIVSFHFQHRGLYLQNRQKLKAFINNVFKQEKMPVHTLQFIFCSDRQLLSINRQYLKHNYYTDIISFNLADKNLPVLGEIYISLDRVRDNAKTLQQFVYLELHRVIFHGVLHLCGYKDKKTVDQALMTKKEDYYLKQYFNSSTNHSFTPKL